MKNETVAEIGATAIKYHFNVSININGLMGDGRNLEGRGRGEVEGVGVGGGSVHARDNPIAEILCD